MAGYHPGRYPLYEADAPPLSPHADDDEFNDGSIGGAWTDFDPGSVGTNTEGDWGLKIAATSVAGDRFTGVYRSVPSGDWTLTTKVSVTGSSVAGFTQAGIVLGEDLSGSPTTSDLWVHLLRYTSARAMNIFTARYSSYQAFNSTFQDITWSRTTAYLRIRRTGTDVATEASVDGIGWIKIDNQSAIFTVNHVALLLDNDSGGAEGAAYFRFYRRSADAATPLLGRFV
jgi:hypothetical protein